MRGQRILIHQYHSHVAFGDAITQQMFFIRERLHRAGIGGEIFARELKGVSRATVRPFAREAIWDGDLLLVHHSSGDSAHESILSLEVPKAIVYHNVTPPEFFAHDAFAASLARAGREQLEAWSKSVVAAFADSRFNARELESLGFPRPQILPLLDLGGETPPAPRLRDAGTLLFVGRLAPHKNQALLVAALAYLNRSESRYRLLLAGTGDPFYTDYLKLLARQLGISREVEFLGKVSHGDLEELYDRADAFVSPSLHEGFGVPLVEAMRHDAVVFALPRAAVGETLGGAGVRLPSERPAEVAAFLANALGSPTWTSDRARLVAIQRDRLDELRREQNGELIAERLRPLVESLRQGPSRPAPQPTV